MKRVIKYLIIIAGMIIGLICLLLLLAFTPGKKTQEELLFLYQIPLHREQIDNNGKKAILK